MDFMFERETQLLQFTPLSFVDRVVESANVQVHNCLDWLQDHIDGQLGECPENERGMQMAASLLEALVDKNFDRWELFCLQKIFAIPPEVQLPLIPGLPLLQNIPNVSEQQNETVENDLVFYRQQLQSIRLWKQSLAEKLFKLDERRKELESQVAALRFLQQAADKDDGSTINDQIELVCKLAADLRASQLGARQFEGPIEVLHQRFQFHRQSKNQQRQSTRQQTVSSALIEDQLHERYCESMEPIMQLLQDME